VNKVPEMQRALLAWYRSSRRDLPWRRARDAYAIWLSETMLQQTRVETVLPYYQRFLEALPTVRSLAEAPESRVLSLWSGLGYYRRARMLHAAAKRVVREHRGQVPRDVEALRQLEGVGEYTAGAVASIAYGVRAALVDGNVTRVLARLFAVEENTSTSAGKRRIWDLARELVFTASADPGDWNQALMELGAVVCTPRGPACEGCPVSRSCAARARGLVDALPRAPAKRPPKEVRRVSLVLVSPEQGRVLMARRRAGVLFGGLWEPPSVDAAADAAGGLAERLGVDAAALKPMGEVRHVLTHRVLRVTVMRGPLTARRRWPIPGPDYDAARAVATADLGDVAHATLTRKVLALAKATPAGVRSRGNP
jgi:A/G-specific adenine glycosylase